MNDRYLFRGKRLDTDLWATGCLVETPTGCFIHQMETFCREKGNTYINQSYKVDPSTLGQCTGLRDKNGTLVFEGDKLHSDGIERWCECPDDEHFAVVEWNNNAACFFGDLRTTVMNMQASLFHDCEVIGNMYEIK